MDGRASEYGLTVKDPNMNIAGRVRHAIESDYPGLTIDTPAGPTMLSSVFDRQKDTAAKSQLMYDLNSEILSLMDQPGDESSELTKRV
jgi:hypothetical protein